MKTIVFSLGLAAMTLTANHLNAQDRGLFGLGKSSKVIVNPTGHSNPDYATVTFENGDVIYVGNAGAQSGHLIVATFAILQKGCCCCSVLLGEWNRWNERRP